MVQHKAADYVDYVQPMAYTFSAPGWSSKTGHFSSYKQSMDALKYWEGRGVAKEKLSLGVPFYAVGFGGASGTGVAFTGPSSLGATIEYKELVNSIESGIYAHSEPNDPEGPYIYSAAKDEIIFYNDSAILAKKGKAVVAQGYAGAMIWELGQDDADQTLLNSISGAIFPEGITTSTVLKSAVNDDFFRVEQGVLRFTNIAVASVRILDIQGQVVVQKKNIQIQNEVSINGLVAGNYIIETRKLTGQSAFHRLNITN